MAALAGNDQSFCTADKVVLLRLVFSEFSGSVLPCFQKVQCYIKVEYNLINMEYCTAITALRYMMLFNFTRHMNFQ